MYLINVAFMSYNIVFRKKSSDYEGKDAKN